MKPLIDPDLILEYTLNRSNPGDNLHEKLENLLRVLTVSRNIKASITLHGLNKIHSIFCIYSKEKADMIIDHLRSFLNIVDHSNSYDIFETARQCNGSIENSIELLCFYEYGFDAIVTEQSSKYRELTLPLTYSKRIPVFWSVESLITRNKLEKTKTKNWGIGKNSSNSSVQLSLIVCPEEELLFKYRIRNGVDSVSKMFNYLKNQGYNGISEQDFISRFKESKTTAKSIIWDMQNFGMIENYNNRITVKYDLLDTGNIEVAQYLNLVLKKHILVQSIYKKLKTDKQLTQWGLDEIIEDVYADNKLTKKTVRDYRSRIISWLSFTKLIERKKSYGTSNIIFTLPVTQKQKESTIELQQLELRLELEITSSYRSTIG
jgi:hypothetical protein